MTEEGSRRVRLKFDTIVLCVSAEILAGEAQLGKNLSAKSTCSDKSLV